MEGATKFHIGGAFPVSCTLKTMTGATLFSGIAAPETAAPWIDWQWCAEIDPFACAVLKYRQAKVPNLGDVSSDTFIDRARAIGPIDILVFGSPCQSFSVAGKRAGLDDARGSLALVALRIVRALRPTWFLFENVPGLLSSWSGEAEKLLECRETDTVVEGDAIWVDTTVSYVEESDFAAFLCGVEECGYSGAWASPDAQWFGVPQRRERIFFVGHSGDWRGPAAVLSELHCLQGNPPPRGQAGEGASHEVIGSLTGSGRGVERTGESRGQDPVISVAYGGNNTSGPIDVATATHSLRADGFDASENGTGRGTPLAVVATLDANYGKLQGASGQDLNHGHSHLIAFDTTPLIAQTVTADMYRSGGAVAGNNDQGVRNCFVVPAITSTDGGGAGVPTVAFQESQTGCREYATAGCLRADGPGHDPVGTRLRSGMAVRRLTPRECERLQGFPDDYTLVPYRGKPASDGPRYRAIGNSMAVPVVAYLLDRIQNVSQIKVNPRL